jgi:hypothetical protein
VGGRSGFHGGHFDLALALRDVASNASGHHRHAGDGQERQGRPRPGPGRTYRRRGRGLGTHVPVLRPAADCRAIDCFARGMPRTGRPPVHFSDEPGRSDRRRLSPGALRVSMWGDCPTEDSHRDGLHFLACRPLTWLSSAPAWSGRRSHGSSPPAVPRCRCSTHASPDTAPRRPRPACWRPTPKCAPRGRSNRCASRGWRSTTTSWPGSGAPPRPSSSSPAADRWSWRWTRPAGRTCGASTIASPAGRRPEPSGWNPTTSRVANPGCRRRCGAGCCSQARGGSRQPTSPRR